MGPISRYMAKPVVPLLGVPMIERSVGVLRSGGVTDIIVNLHHLPDTVKGVLGDGSRLGVKISYSHENPILGTGGGIGKARDFFDGQAFVVINSDVILEVDLSDVLSFHRKKRGAATLVLRPDVEKRYCSVWVDCDDGIRQIEQFPAEADVLGCEPQMFAGLHVIEPVWFDYAPDTAVYDSIRDVYGPMIAAGEYLYGYRFSGRWIDLGSAPRLLAATVEHLAESIIPPSALVGAGTEIERSVLAPHTQIAEGCRVVETICLGKARIGEGSYLRRCILCPGTSIESGSVISDRVIDGKNMVPMEDLEQ